MKCFLTQQKSGRHNVTANAVPNLHIALMPYTSLSNLEIDLHVMKIEKNTIERVHSLVNSLFRAKQQPAEMGRVSCVATFARSCD